MAKDKEQLASCSQCEFVSLCITLGIFSTAELELMRELMHEQADRTIELSLKYANDGESREHECGSLFGNRAVVIVDDDDPDAYDRASHGE